MTYEIIGIAGTILILIAFSCDTERKIRIFDAAGAALFVVYGFLTRTWSTTLLNALLIVIQIVKLHKGQRGGSRSPEKENTMTG